MLHTVLALHPLCVIQRVLLILDQPEVNGREVLLGQVGVTPPIAYIWPCLPQFTRCQGQPCSESPLSLLRDV